MAKATKLPSGTWRVYLYLGKVDGKEVRRSITGKTKKEAEQNAARYMLENHLDDTPMTVGEAVDKYIRDCSVSLSPSTLRGYMAIQRNYISGISSYMADKVTRDNLQGWVNELAREHSPKTVKNAYGLVHSSILSVRPSFNVVVKLPQKAAEIVLIPTEEEVRLMLDTAKPRLKMCIMLGAFGGLRRGEVCYLHYRDLKDGCIHIHGDMVKAPGEGWVEKDHAKTDKSNRIVRVPEFVYKALGTGDDDEKVIKCNPNCITNTFGKLMLKLDLPYHFHLLRHYFASVLIAEGVPLTYVQALGGWENSSTLEKIYTHILQSSSNEYSKQVSDFFTSRFA